MNTDQILDQIIRANPKPAEAEAPGSVLTRSALLVELDRRSGDMKTQEQPTRIEQVPSSARVRRRSRWALPAMAGAAALIVAVVVAAALLSREDAVKSQYADAAAAGDPAAIAGLFSDSFRTGDIDAVRAYLHPEFATREASDDEIGLLTSWFEFERALYGRNEPGPSSCEGTDPAGWYLCTYIEPPGSVLASLGRLETTRSTQIVDGLVRRMDIAGELVSEGVISEYVIDDFERPLGEFALAADPDGSAAACDVLTAIQAGDRATIGLGVVLDGTCGAFLAGFVDDYLASLG